MNFKLAAKTNSTDQTDQGEETYNLVHNIGSPYTV